MGSIKVPAAVMYAHKIANYANDLSILPNDALSCKLHYLWGVKLKARSALHRKWIEIQISNKLSLGCKENSKSEVFVTLLID